MLRFFAPWCPHPRPLRLIPLVPGVAPQLRLCDGHIGAAENRSLQHRCVAGTLGCRIRSGEPGARAGCTTRATEGRPSGADSGRGPRRWSCRKWGSVPVVPPRARQERVSWSRRIRRIAMGKRRDEVSMANPPYSQRAPLSDPSSRLPTTCGRATNRPRMPLE